MFHVAKKSSKSEVHVKYISTLFDSVLQCKSRYSLALARRGGSANELRLKSESKDSISVQKDSGAQDVDPTTFESSV